MALVADGWHMSSHALAMGLAYVVHVAGRSPFMRTRMSFGTGKISALGGYTSALLLCGDRALGRSAERLAARLARPRRLRARDRRRGRWARRERLERAHPDRAPTPARPAACPRPPRRRPLARRTSTPSDARPEPRAAVAHVARGCAHEHPRHRRAARRQDLRLGVPRSRDRADRLRARAVLGRAPRQDLGADAARLHAGFGRRGRGPGPDRAELRRRRASTPTCGNSRRGSSPASFRSRRTSRSSPNTSRTRSPSSLPHPRHGRGESLPGRALSGRLRLKRGRTAGPILTFARVLG